MNTTPSKVQLKNSFGKIIEIKDFQNKQELVFDLQNLANGTYFSELILANGNIIRHQFSVKDNNLC